jgi:hypothetical protein
MDVPELFKSIISGFLGIVRFDIDTFGSANRAVDQAISISNYQEYVEIIVKRVMESLNLK